MNKYTELSDFEINKKATEKLGIACECDMWTVIIYRDSECHAFDPCNNIEQAWEIMMECNICVVKNMDENYYDAYIDFEYYTEYKYHQSHEKPLVSAMLCFLELNK